MLAGYIEGTLQSEPGSADCALIEQASNEGDAMGYAAGRREFGQRVSGVGRPVAARLGDFHKTGAKGERRMTGEAGNGEYFVPRRWNGRMSDPPASADERKRYKV